MIRLGWLTAVAQHQTEGQPCSFPRPVSLRKGMQIELDQAKRRINQLAAQIKENDRELRQVRGRYDQVSQLSNPPEESSVPGEAPCSPRLGRSEGRAADTGRCRSRCCCKSHALSSTVRSAFGRESSPRKSRSPAVRCYASASCSLDSTPLKLPATAAPARPGPRQSPEYPIFKQPPRD